MPEKNNPSLIIEATPETTGAQLGDTLAILIGAVTNLTIPGHKETYEALGLLPGESVGSLALSSLMRVKAKEWPSERVVILSFNADERPLLDSLEVSSDID